MSWHCLAKTTLLSLRARVSGIGRAIAGRLRAREGAQIVLLDVNADTIAEAAQGDPQGPAARPRAFALGPSTKTRTIALRWPSRSPRRSGRSRSSFNNGRPSTPPQRLHRGPRKTVAKDWKRYHLAQSSTASFNVTQAFPRGPLARQAKGRIVNIGSIQSFVHLRTPKGLGGPTPLPKHGVARLSPKGALQWKLGKEGRCASTRSGRASSKPTSTPMCAPTNSGAGAGPFVGSHPARADRQARGYPWGRRSFLHRICRPPTSTGTIVMVDGGYRTVWVSAARRRVPADRDRFRITMHPVPIAAAPRAFPEVQLGAARSAINLSLTKTLPP